MSSIIRGRGGVSPHSPLACLPIEQIGKARQVVYLVVDGVGCEQVEEYLATYPDSPFFFESLSFNHHGISGYHCGGDHQFFRPVPHRLSTVSLAGSCIFPTGLWRVLFF